MANRHNSLRSACPATSLLLVRDQAGGLEGRFAKSIVVFVPEGTKKQ